MRCLDTPWGYVTVPAVGYPQAVYFDRMKERARMSQTAYRVPDMSCSHCVTAVTEEVSRVAGVAAVDVDLVAKRVSVRGVDVDGAAVVAAIDEAGYQAVAA
jgi:copper chaperone